MPFTDEHFTKAEAAALHDEAKNSKSASPEHVPTPLEKVAEARRDLGYFVKNVQQFQSNYPEVDAQLTHDFPTLHQDVEQLLRLLKQGSAPDAVLSDAELVAWITAYNTISERVNRAFSSLGDAQLAAGDPLHTALNAGEQLTLNADQKKETELFARQLYTELFPESYSSQFVRWCTNQAQLEDYQKVLVAPAEGIEAVVGGFINLANPQTYKDLADGIQTACGMDYQEWCLAWKTVKAMYEGASKAEVAEFSISFIVAVCFLLGGASKLSQISKGLKAPAYLMPAIESVTVGSRTLHYGEKLQALPLGVLAGLKLKYVR